MSTDICLPMKRSPVTGLFSRDGTFVECQMRRSHIYSDVAEKGAGILHLEKKSGLALFNTRGGLIPIGNVVIDGDSKVVWTLGAICRPDTSLQSRPGLELESKISLQNH